MFKPVRHLIGAGILAVLTVVSVLLARLLPKFWFSFYTGFSRKAMGLLGTLWGWLPFPAWELLLVLLVVAVIVGLVVAIRKKRFLGWLAALLELAVLLVFLFVDLWGLNHFAPTIGEQTGLQVEEFGPEQLKAATAYYAEMAGIYAKRVERDANGDVVLPEFSVLSDEAVAAYGRLAEYNDRFALSVPRAKPLLVSKAFAYMGVTGIFVCYTGEPAVSTECYSLAKPYTICHELGHSLAVAREDEANYLGFLACRASQNDLFLYSGYYNAFIYCYNALFEESPSAALSLWNACPEEMIHDSNVHVEHNRQYEGKVQEVAQAVNNSYLETFDEPGVKSYGLVVNYLIAEYLNNGQ